MRTLREIAPLSLTYSTWQSNRLSSPAISHLLPAAFRAGLLAILLCTATTFCNQVLEAQHSTDAPTVTAHRPTIVAFFPNATKTDSKDADSSEALSDLEFYSERVRQPLSQLGISFYKQYGNSFRIRTESESILFTPAKNTPGYYFITPGKKPYVEYGVMTDIDLLALARRYFGATNS